MNSTTRTEQDALGGLSLPADAYWGIHTARALHNFKLLEQPVWPEWIRAIIQVKSACAQTNGELGYLTSAQQQAILQACHRFLSGDLNIDAQFFPVDALQGGAGTSLNMNVNEVLANVAIESLGGPKGEYTNPQCPIHPIEQVNLHQSTNDVVPTALKMASIEATRTLSQGLAKLQGMLQQLEQQDAAIIKMGRTELQDAVPISLGAEWGAMAEAIARDRWRTFKAEERLRLVNLGGTAVGTGLTAPRQYIFRVLEVLRTQTGLNLTRGETLMDTTANGDCYVEVAGLLNACASTLCKIAGDLRLMNYMGDIRLPQQQVGSSIMPSKINPVSAEATIQVCLKVMANSSLISQCTSRSTFQIIEFLPLLGHSLLESFRLLTAISHLLVETLQNTLRNADHCRAHLENSPTLITAFLPHIGYEAASRTVKAYIERDQAETGSRQSFKQFLSESLGADLVDTVLAPKQFLQLGYQPKPRSRSLSEESR